MVAVIHGLRAARLAGTYYRQSRHLPDRGLSAGAVGWYRLVLGHLFHRRGGGRGAVDDVERPRHGVGRGIWRPHGDTRGLVYFLLPCRRGAAGADATGGGRLVVFPPDTHSGAWGGAHRPPRPS